MSLVIEPYNQKIDSFPQMSSDEFYEFCRENPDVNVELNAQGDVIFMPPADCYSDSVNVEIIAQLYNWHRQLAEPGLVFGPTAGFTLPNRAVRAPDAAWIPASQWNALTESQQRNFAKTCPLFVVELMSPSDRLAKSQEKMTEWLENGAQLGILIHRAERKVFVYRPGEETVELENPESVPCDPELPGFVLEMQRIF
jgi:Uma2 family endonuclease